MRSLRLSLFYLLRKENPETLLISSLRLGCAYAFILSFCALTKEIICKVLKI